MTPLLNELALAVTAAGVVSAGACLATTRAWRAALAVLLDMLTAAGLVRLAEPPSVARTAGAALILLIRKLAVLGLDVDRFSHPGSLSLGLLRRIRLLPPTPHSS